MCTVFTLGIQTPQPRTILVLKFEQVSFTTRCYVFNVAGWKANRVDTDETLQNKTQHFAEPHLGLHSLLRPVCPITYHKKSSLTLKVPRKPASENVVCLCRLLNILANFLNLILHTGKQCGPWSDCSWSGSTLFAEMTYKITSRWEKADDNCWDWRFKG